MKLLANKAAFMDLQAQLKRRDEWYRLTREHIGEYFNPDGLNAGGQRNPLIAASGKISTDMAAGCVTNMIKQ